MPLFRFSFFLISLTFSALWSASSWLVAAPTDKEVRAAMEKATDFMMNRVSNRGGFLYHYTEDLSKQWGEIPARSSQIWVQPPGTPTVGEMLLEAYQATGDVHAGWVGVRGGNTGREAAGL